MTRYVLAVLTISLLGCAGMTGTSFDNQAACVAYVESYNAKPCLKAAQQNAATMCPASLNTSVDLRPMYTCMAENAKCKADGTPDLAGMTSCSRAQ